MKQRVFVFLGVLATSIWSVASASGVTYTFGNGVQNSSSSGISEFGGTVFTGSPDGFNNGGSAPLLNIYGETVPNGLIPGNPPDDGGPGLFGATSGTANGTNGTTGLFEVTNNVGGNTATGIAPYLSSELTGYYPNQNLTLENGITENEVLLLNLSNFSAGSTISFVMQTGVAAGPSGINVWSVDTTGTPVSGTPLGIGTFSTNSINSSNTNSLTKEAITDLGINGGGGYASTTVNFSGLTGLTVGTGLNQTDWIAIQADCHYLLLDSITITPGTVPEPSFYGFFALAMVGLVIGARKLRARAAAAAEQA